MKRLLTVILVLILSFSTTVNANVVTNPNVNMYVGRIVEIIDGEVFKIVVSKTKQTKVVKLIGINTEGNNEAYEYALANLLGKDVFVIIDSHDTDLPKTNNWDNVYIYNTGTRTYNHILIENGLARLDSSYLLADDYKELKIAEDMVKNANIGIWKKDSSEDEHSSKININTANHSLIANTLVDTDFNLASKIINYRKHNIFNSIEEIKFVDERLDYLWLEKNRPYLSVVSNINTASELEITSLIPDGYNIEKVKNLILDYRLFNNIESIDKIRNIEGLNIKLFDYFKDYITLQRIKTIPNPSTVLTANINTATKSEIKAATKLSDNTVDYIIKNRDNGKYAYNNLAELTKYPINLPSYELNYLTDNLSVLTNVNTSSFSEIKSLLGNTSASDSTKNYIANNIINNRPYYSINELKSKFGIYFSDVNPYITLNNVDNNVCININLATKDNVIKFLNMSASDVTKFKNRSGPYYYKNQLNFDYGNYVNKFSLYTNINTASKEELMLLDSTITLEIVNDIIKFRQSEPFTSASEYKVIFEKHNKLSIYNKINNFVVFY